MQQEGYNTILVFNSTDARRITPLTGSTEKTCIKTACRSAGTFHAYGIIPPSGREIPGFCRIKEKALYIIFDHRY
jgi:hypothetical protein